MDENKLFWLWLTLKIKYNKTIEALLEYFGTVENIYKSEEYKGISDRRTVELLKDKSLDEAKEVYNSTIKAGAFIITYDSTDYPEILKNIYDPPYVLYAKGNMFDWNSFIGIGIVGTRAKTCDDYGRAATSYFARELSKNGFMVISGLADGLDAVAARTALKMGKPTIGVLGCGIDIVYPITNEELYKEVEREGLILSEYPPGFSPTRWSFPQRNRIISGLSKGVIITQAPQGSGALITARLAYENGRDVFAVPADIFNKNSKGSNHLIEDGAIPAFGIYSILREYPEYAEKNPEIVRHYRSVERNQSVQKNIIKPQKNQPVKKEETVDLSGLSDVQRKIYSCVQNGNDHIDLIVRETGMAPGKINNELLMLELQGIIKGYPGNKYGIN